MNKKEILNKIRTKEWWKLEGPGVFQLFFAPAMGFAKMVKYYPSMKFWGFILLENNNYIYQLQNTKDSIEIIDCLLRNNKKDNLYIKKKIKQWEKLKKKTYNIGKEIDSPNLSRVSNKKLFSLFKRYSDSVTDTWAVPLALEGNSIYFERVLLPKIIKETRIPEPDLMEKISILAMPEKSSFIKEEHISILKLALDFINKKIKRDIKKQKLKRKFPFFYKKLLNHQKKFFWIRNNYLDSYVISINEFLKEVKAIIKEKGEKEIKKEIKELLDFKKLKERKKKIRKELKISKGLLKEIGIFSLFGSWQDKRKEMDLKTGHYITLLIKEISKRMGIDYTEGYHLLNKEIEDFLLISKKANLATIKKRKEMLVLFAFGNGQFEIVQGKNAFLYHNEIFKKIKRDNLSKKFKGFVASTGGKNIIQGKVSIVFNVKKEKFKQGNILVTSMTRPEFVPLMKKAKAVITNEGGITSHAAIISRELKIPCIIGTKVATDILKDGNQVELNLISGDIKIK